MSDTKDTTSFFRKVVKFVANPTTEWTELGMQAEEGRENEFAKGELKAMIERKRRNDFVRKREFDVLRRVRREGLTGDQLAALGSSSRLDDSEGRMPESGARPDSGVKAKIDEIEQQMVGDAPYGAAVKRSPAFYNATTEAAAMDVTGIRTVPQGAPGLTGGRVEELPGGRGTVAGAARATVGAEIDTAVTPLAAAAPVAAASLNGPRAALQDAREAIETTHDADLDEAVIAFANADFEQCEHALLALARPGGARAQHAETWLALFDLYRAIGQPHKFESLALDYAQQFGRSAPQWISMPKLVAEATRAERPRRLQIEGSVGWTSLEHIDADVVAQLASLSLQMPLPWVFDWSALRGIDAEGCARLSDLFRSWMGQEIDMRWVYGERLFTTLREAAPTGARDADPAFWQLHLDALRMTDQPEQFEEAAIDYCVTYEVSPPSWEDARCHVRITGEGDVTLSAPLAAVTEVVSSFMESRPNHESGGLQVGSVELSGQLVGDISATLEKIDGQLGGANIVNVSCTRLIRVDFIAAGDLLNWVLARRSEDRRVRFIEAHRIVALFFGAMGITEHAEVKVRNV